MKRSLASAIAALFLALTGCGADNHVGAVYLNQDGHTYYTPPTPIFRDVTLRLESDHIDLTRMPDDATVDSLALEMTSASVEGEEVIDLFTSSAEGIPLDLSFGGADAVAVNFPTFMEVETIVLGLENVALTGSLVEGGAAYSYDIEITDRVELEVPFPEGGLEAEAVIDITLCTSCALADFVPVLQEWIAEDGVAPGSVVTVFANPKDERTKKIKEAFKGGMNRGTTSKIRKSKDGDEDQDDNEDDNEGDDEDEDQEEDQDEDQEEDQESADDGEEEGKKLEVKEEKQDEKQEVKEEKKDQKEEVKEEKKVEVKEEKKEEKQEVKEEKKDQKEEVKEEKKEEVKEEKEEVKGEVKDEKKDKGKK